MPATGLRAPEEFSSFMPERARRARVLFYTAFERCALPSALSKERQAPPPAATMPSSGLKKYAAGLPKPCRLQFASPRRSRLCRKCDGRTAALKRRQRAGSCAVSNRDAPAREEGCQLEKARFVV